ncbi:50S ribosomal protein L10 [Candidatus Falkowbacteria bacterium]|jgi:large subunit ribosomal protein L10|nr:50S ribosomal protein L10 [Candidatus Falkowbacteria bacterium]MBT5502896.1 50S ribosomal protein L10 [Candidatus Falkowbacteria bacterium]MBT6573740.1 50S ribosomal protein L10 [Candidatus Falkowbacteria bacterium]MBT7349116.1 50S ribosomal protein L10 [Candidatus Falkowbacteria bacterium]MBT7500067.1 50S ribosomal protein L10 [Candidatus Falkowbacteria bacterium]
MAKTKQQKQEAIDQIVAKIKDAKGLVIANHEGLTVNDSQVLREKCKEQNVEFVAVKKTLLKLALESAGIKDADTKSMTGGLAIAISGEDEVAPAKILKDFAKTHSQVVFCGGVLEGTLVSAEQVGKLADLPSKLELLAKVVGSIKAPVTGFVNVLSGNLRGLVNVLNAIKENK